MICRITYWTAGDQKVTRTVAALNEEAAIELLAHDLQAPLAQVDHIETVGPIMSDGAAAKVHLIETGGKP
jgi:hypothetical protein